VPTRRRFTVQAILREPLFHFLVIGLGLFLLFGQASPGDSESRRIVVGQGQVDALVRQHQSTWNRPPTQAELQSLIDVYVRDEILYREGVALGLDQDDAVIKRRVRQKYELIAEEENRTEPTDDDLRAYMEAHPAAFVRSAVVSLDQVYFDPSVASPENVAAAKVALSNGASPASYGQASLLPRRIENSSLDLVARDFGKTFARQVGSVPTGQWIGPVASGIGVHLVRVRSRLEPALPPLDQVRSAVAREWESDRRSRARDADLRKLREEYDVVVDGRLPSASTP
jgi:parvulin-like peptidyl-prolyl isomerase